MSDKPELLYATPVVVQITSMPVPLIVSLPDLDATESLARRLASVAKAGDCILLEGPLGAGKTALARAFLRAVAGDPAMEVPSPSFTLVQIYDTKIGPVFHYDLWRLEGSDSLAELDWEDALDAVVLVEWPDRLGTLRPADALTITLRLLDEEAREATLVGWNGRMDTLSAPSDAFRSRRSPSSPSSSPPSSSWPGLSGPSMPARAAMGGPDKPGYDDRRDHEPSRPNGRHDDGGDHEDTSKGVTP